MIAPNSSAVGSTWILLIAILNVTVATQPIFLLAASAPQAGPELGFSAIGLGFFTASFFLAAAIVSVPAGKVVERIGWSRAMRFTMAGAVMTLVSVAAFAHSRLVLAVLLVVAACFYGFANPAANLALARFTRPGRQATFFGMKHAGIPASTLLAGLAVPLLNLRWGWRWAYVAAAVVGLVVMALIPRHEPDGPHQQRPVDDSTTSMSRSDLNRLTVMAALVTVAPGALGIFTVSAGVAAGLSEGAAGWALSIAGISTIVARAAYGFAVDRWHLREVRLLVWVVALGAVSVVLLAFASDEWFVLAVVGAFVFAWGWAGLLTFTVVRGNQAHPAAATARTQAGVFVGAGVGPPIFGWLVDHVQYQGAWLAVVATLAAGAVVAYPLARKATVTR